MHSKKEICFLLVILCFLVYANSLNNAFVSDDIPAILKNPLIGSWQRVWLIPAQLLNSFNYLIAKFNPFPYHLTNIILHALNTILVFFFLCLFFETEGSFLGASLFAVHPIHTEAVTWISGKVYSISALFILSAYLLYQRFNPPQRSKLPYYLLSLLLFAYFIIENYSFSLLFPFLLILSDITFTPLEVEHRRCSPNLRFGLLTGFRRWKLWLPFLGIVILRIILAKGVLVGRISQVAKDMGVKTTWTNPLFNLVYSLFSHLGLLLWPGKLTLYHEPAVISLFALKAGIVFLLILVLSLPFIFKKAKEIFFGITIFILFLAPTYSPVMISWLVAERYLYLPSITLSIFATFLYERYVKVSFNADKRKSNADKRRFICDHLRAICENLRSRSFLHYLFIFIIASYAVRTVARNEDWKSPERFWRQTLLVSYNSPRAHNNMGDIYSREGNVKGAIAEFKKAIELNPDYADAYHNLANTYHRHGDLQKAIQYYQLATSFNPELFESHFNLGVIYLNRAEWELALKHLKTALKIRPDETNVRTMLKLALEKSSTK